MTLDPRPERSEGGGVKPQTRFVLGVLACVAGIVIVFGWSQG